MLGSCTAFLEPRTKTHTIFSPRVVKHIVKHRTPTMHLVYCTTFVLRVVNPIIKHRTTNHTLGPLYNISSTNCDLGMLYNICSKDCKPNY